MSIDKVGAFLWLVEYLPSGRDKTKRQVFFTVEDARDAKESIDRAFDDDAGTEPAEIVMFARSDA